MTDHSPALDTERFARIEKRCTVHFNEGLRQSLNECITFWSEQLAEPEQFKSPLAPHLKDKRQGARKRRQPFVMELALHFEVAGGKPTVNGYNRDVGKATGFARFLLEVYDVLPSKARPPSRTTFVRDSELVAATVAANRAAVEDLGFSGAKMKTPGGSVAGAEYMLRTMTAWRR